MDRQANGAHALEEHKGREMEGKWGGGGGGGLDLRKLRKKVGNEGQRTEGREEGGLVEGRSRRGKAGTEEGQKGKKCLGRQEGENEPGEWME